ncbi:uncharacterized protein P884DRAFT_269179 [Thermothelomyces heterothallicus CBS 202.75]|uniref:uncharacterized protein n=1 Tax=Thermothelomyces heterothallicus CBS 202.75 TaxID=1149848 RepID=UPI0037427532
MDFLKGRQSPSPETLLPVDAREKTVEGNTTVDNRPSPTPVSKMTYARRTIAVLLVSLLVLNGVASASSWTPCHKRATDQQTSKSASFPAKLKEASPESLHGLLDRFLPDKLRDGAFESEHRAAAAAHRADPVKTTTTNTIFEVRKRDDSNATDTSSSTTPPESSTSDTSPEKTSSSEPPTETKTTTTTTSQTESPVPPSSSSTTPPPPTSSSEAPPPATSSTEDSTPTSTPSTSSPSSSSPSETTLTTTTKPPSTTTRPPPSSRATTETFTSTSPDGVVVVVTRTNFVPAEGTETPAPSSTGVSPSLQNSAVRCLGVGSILAAGMAGVAMLLVAM